MTLAGRRIFIVVPAATTSSPIKGAAALANALSRERQVSFVALKPGIDGFQLLDDTVERVSLSEAGSWVARLAALRRLLREAGGREAVAVVSFCLSADVFSRWCADLAVTCASVRGHLPEVYPETYGSIGGWLGRRHLRLLRRLDHVVSMTPDMAALVGRHIGRPSPVIGNCVDENRLERYRRGEPPEGPWRFVFTGSMVPNKQPDAVLRAVRTLQERGVVLRLDMYGDGPLLPELRRAAATLPDSHAVSFHGHVSKPYAGVSASDVLILPSRTEGVSRSALEALFLGVPCIVREIPGSQELIQQGRNGARFTSDSELPSSMTDVAAWSRRRTHRGSLLPADFTQATAAARYLTLIEK